MNALSFTSIVFIGIGFVLSAAAFHLIRKRKPIKPESVLPVISDSKPATELPIRRNRQDSARISTTKSPDAHKPSATPERTFAVPAAAAKAADSPTAAARSTNPPELRELESKINSLESLFWQISSRMDDQDNRAAKEMSELTRSVQTLTQSNAKTPLYLEAMTRKILGQEQNLANTQEHIQAQIEALRTEFQQSQTAQLTALREEISVELVKRYQTIIADFVTADDLGRELAQLAHIQLAAAQNRYREMEWLIDAIAAVKTGDSQRIQAGGYRWFVSNLLDKLRNILDRLAKPELAPDDQKLLRELEDRFNLTKGKAEQFFSEKLLRAAAHEQAQDLARAGTSNLLPENQRRATGWEQLQAGLANEHQWFWTLIASQLVPPLAARPTAASLGQHAPDIRGTFLRMVFPEISNLLWDTGKAFSKQTRTAVTELLSTLYSQFGVTWIWPVCNSDLFNPELHQRAAERPARAPRDAVIDLLSLGIVDNGRVLRRAIIETSAGS